MAEITLTGISAIYTSTSAKKTCVTAQFFCAGGFEANLKCPGIQ